MDTMLTSVTCMDTPDEFLENLTKQPRFGHVTKSEKLNPILVAERHLEVRFQAAAELACKPTDSCCMLFVWLLLFMLQNSFGFCQFSKRRLPPYLGHPVAPPSTDVDQVSSAPITQEEPGKAKVFKAPEATRRPQFCPLHVVGGDEFGPTKVYALFSLSDLKQIKVDLGKFSDDPDKYIDVLQGLGQSFELD
ncbi:hypothetical protein AAY473_018993 [Plecturocebus cupreus]